MAALRVASTCLRQSAARLIRQSLSVRGLATTKSPKDLFESLDTFTNWHVGPDDNETEFILSKLGFDSMESFLAATAPQNIRIAGFTVSNASILALSLRLALQSNNQVLPPSSSLVTPAPTLRALDSTSRSNDALQGIASQPLSLSQSLEALDVAMQLYSLGDLHDPLPSLDSMSWLDIALDSVASQSLSSSSSLEALEAAVQCDSLGDLHDLLPSLDSMSWLDECEG
ncbi:hypothetical protein P692DRAFT_20873879 [Suillus brevipes Sb2]|nr:hypothetical protein P692DRAFT_20873879 [Suillus brevipes Sb2]